MFGKLKDKLKGALSAFSSKAEEEAEVKEEVVEVEAKPVKKEVKKEEKKETPKKEVKEKPAKKEKKVSKKIKEVVPDNEVHITFFDHGSTEDNEKGVSTGWNDPSLSEAGKEECQKIKETVDVEYDLIYSSDLLRAIETVKLVWPKSKFIQDKRLRACNYGKLNGKEKVNLKNHISEAFEGGQSLKDIENQVLELLNELYHNHKGKSIAIVSHRGPKDAIEVLVNGLSWKDSLNRPKLSFDKLKKGTRYVLSEEVKPLIEEKEEVEEIPVEEEKKETKGFFGKLKDVFSSEEKLELIDEKGKVIGEEARSKIHEEGLRHKEVHVIIFNDKEEVLLQRRSATTETHPNLLDSSVGGHVDIGEEWETAALRELKEETGIKAEKEDLIFLEDFSNKTHDKVTNKINNYLRKVYAYHFKDEKVELEKGKATSLEFWSIDKIFKLSKEEKKEFIPTIISKTYLSYYKKLKELVTKEEPVKEVKEKPKEELKEKKPEPKEPIETPKITEDLEEKGFFGKIKQTLTTKTISNEKFEELFWDLEVVLLENNVSVEVIERIKNDLKEELVDKPLPRDVIGKINETLKNTLFEILTYDKIDLLSQTNKPLVIALFGINGAGKTTSVAKLAHYFKEHGKSVVLAACDTFRAAAIQQLEEHATKLDVKIIKHDYGSDSAAVAFDAIKYAEKNNIDVVLIDTAGRLHSNTNLMAELEKVIRVTNPDFKIFVGESITGNDCIEQAQKFNELVEMDGAILTKADVDEKGGAPLSISYVIKKPILFLGVGQGYDDLEEFDKNVILSRLGFE